MDGFSFPEDNEKYFRTVVTIAGHLIFWWYSEEAQTGAGIISDSVKHVVVSDLWQHLICLLVWHSWPDNRPAQQ